MQAYSVGDINKIIKRTLEGEFLLKNCIIEGTISNLKKHSTGHYYFSLIDDTGSIDMALWKSTAIKKDLVGRLENGLLVQVRGTINFYEKMGRLSIICDDIMIGEKSDYQIAFEKLKQELYQLGYFDERHKLPIPPMATCIGVVTSSSGAVIHDILHVASRRNHHVQFKVFNVPVQGMSAGPIIAKGVKAADADPDVDLIIVGRGGGSMEDLWCFNDKTLVEAMYHAKTPIISAVGHEVDYTLCDFVADARGATPSHAAEMCVYPLEQLHEEINDKIDYLHRTMQYRIQLERQKIFSITNRYCIVPMLKLLHQQKNHVHQLGQRVFHIMEQSILKKKQELALVATQLESVNPLALLTKGFSKVEIGGKSLQSIKDVQKGDTLHIYVPDGMVQAEVKEIEPHG